MTSRRGIVIAAVLSALLVGEAEASAQLTVWTQGVGQKVQPTTKPGTATAVTIEGAKDSVVASQIVAHATGGALATVNMKASALGDGAGHQIAASNITFFREDFINFTGITATPGNVPVPAKSPTHDGNIPDPLVPFLDPYAATPKPVGAPFAVVAGHNQPVWMDVAIPASTVAGTYKGTVTVTATGQKAVVVPVTLTVWNLVLPDMRTMTTHFKMSTDNVIYYHSGTYDCSGAGTSDCWLSYDTRARTIVKRYEAMAHAHRVDTAQTFLPDPSNGCLPPTDWSGYDAAMAPYMSGAYWADHVPSSRLETPFSPGVTWGLEASCTATQYTALAKAWAAHLSSKGWLARAIVYAADEPDPSQYPAIAQDALRMKAGNAAWKPQIMDTTAPDSGNVALLDPALGIYTVCLACYDDWWTQGAGAPYGRAKWPTLMKQGIRLWFYESNAQAAPYPTYATNTLLGLEPRMMKWGAWYEHASGFLMWDMADWDLKAPWGPEIMYGKTGDGVLLYPGNHNGTMAPAGSPAGVAIDGPIPSYRLKMIRDGLQDWALFTLADQKGLTTYARGQVARAYGQLGGCTWEGCSFVNGKFFWQANDALMLEIRHNIALKIAAAS